MPNILVKIPSGSFPGESRQVLARGITEAATTAEQMPLDNPASQAMCWVVIEEADAGHWTCGGTDTTGRLVPCIVLVNVPAGVLTAQTRTLYVDQMHQAFSKAMPSADTRRIAVSTIIQEVPDGQWGVNGSVWHLADFARAAGYAHLQNLLPPQKQAAV